MVPRRRLSGIPVVNKYNTVFYFVKALNTRFFPGLFEKSLLPLARRLIVARKRPAIMRQISTLMSTDPFPPIRAVEIETINRCNNSCGFCPVNAKIDPRSRTIMEESLFLSIVDQLKELDVRWISLFSNNEPLLDKRIPHLCEIARERFPQARLALSTNGSLLTIDVFRALMRSLDHLLINNYNDDLVLNEPVKAIRNHCLDKSEYFDKVLISLRKKNEPLSTRGGLSPNRSAIKALKCSCALPFSQLVIRPDGKVSLCCNDATGGMTMGDVSKQRIADLWHNHDYLEVREKLLLRGRQSIDLCSGCDAGV